MKQTQFYKLLLSSCIAIALTPVAFAENRIDFNNIANTILKKNLDALSSEKKAHAIAIIKNLNASQQDVHFLRVDRKGAVFYADTFLPIASANNAVSFSAANEIAPADAFKLHSKPTSSKVIYLDFNGHDIEGTSWNSSIATYLATPYDLDSDPDTFNTAELASIASIWRRIAEDFALFDIDVTTEEPSTFTANTGRILITKSIDSNGQNMPSNTGGGVAYVNVFGNVNYVASYSPALVYYDHLLDGRADFVAEAASHEMGHNMGLSHDATSSAGYYSGHGTGDISWGPIMGTGYYRNVSQWSKGSYPGATNSEDDIGIIATKTGVSADDHANSYSGATPLLSDANGNISSTNPISDPDNTLPENKGIIGSQTDVDTFSFTAAAGAVSLNVSSINEASNTKGGNLDISLSLHDSSGSQIASDNPDADVNASLSTTVAAGDYYLKVTGAGSGVDASTGNVNYDDYGSQGQYFIAGNIPVSSSDTTAPTPDPMTWSTSPYSIDRFSITMVATTAVDETSSVTYKFICTNTGASCTESNWQASPNYTASGLNPSTYYAFKVKARDAAGNETVLSDEESATTMENFDPVAIDDIATVDNISPIVISVLDNDIDDNGDTLDIISVTTATNGTVANAGSTITYNSNPDYVGLDSFTYTVSDGYGGTAIGNVDVTVTAAPNNQPEANNDSASVNNSSSITVDVLANDTDADNDTLSISAITQGSNGSVVIIGNEVKYTPNSNFVGTDTFTYTISDGSGGADTATVTITVSETPVNNKQPLVYKDIAYVFVNESVVIDVLSNDFDRDFDPLTITSVTSIKPNNRGSVRIENNKLVYDANHRTGRSTFNYTISDGKGGINTGKVVVRAKRKKSNRNYKPIATTDLIRVVKGHTVTIDVLSNDFDLNGDSLTVVSAVKRFSRRNDSLKILDNKLVYTAGANKGKQKLFYVVTDSKGGYAFKNVKVKIVP